MVPHESGGQRWPPKAGPLCATVDFLTNAKCWESKTLPPALLLCNSPQELKRPGLPSRGRFVRFYLSCRSAGAAAAASSRSERSFPPAQRSLAPSARSRRCSPPCSLRAPSTTCLRDSPDRYSSAALAESILRPAGLIGHPPPPAFGLGRCSHAAAAIAPVHHLRVSTPGRPQPSACPGYARQ